MTEARASRVPEFIEKLGPINELFLNQDPIKQDQENVQKTLRAIWDICSAFYPGERSGIVTLSIPSIRLVELGLVSDQTGHRIERRLEKISDNTDVTAEKNTIVIEKTKTGFKLTERYIEMEEPHAIDLGEGYIDRFTEEITELEKVGENLTIKINKTERVQPPQLHALDRVWVPIGSQQNYHPELFPPKVDAEQTGLVITSSRINTTLAFLVVGIVPGIIAR